MSAREDEEIDDELRLELENEPTPTARAEFREELRRRFVEAEPAAKPTSVQRARPRLLAAAAVLVAATVIASLWFGFRTGAPFEVLEPDRSTVRIDGAAREVASGGLPALAAGSSIATGDTALALRLDERLVMELAPHTELEIVVLPERSRPGTLELRLTSGALRVATRAGFAPNRMLVHAPDADVLVVGTEFGVDVVPGEATCVCCVHGRVEVAPCGAPERRQAVDAGGNAWYPVGGAPPMLGTVKPMHADPIEALRRFD